jgi:hypothetical protein
MSARNFAKWGGSRRKGCARAPRTEAQRLAFDRDARYAIEEIRDDGGDPLNLGERTSLTQEL